MSYVIGKTLYGGPQYCNNTNIYHDFGLFPLDVNIMLMTVTV